MEDFPNELYFLIYDFLPLKQKVAIDLDLFENCKIYDRVTGYDIVKYKIKNQKLYNVSLDSNLDFNKRFVINLRLIITDNESNLRNINLDEFINLKILKINNYRNNFNYFHKYRKLTKLTLTSFVGIFPNLKNIEVEILVIKNTGNSVNLLNVPENLKNLVLHNVPIFQNLHLLKIETLSIIDPSSNLIYPTTLKRLEISHTHFENLDLSYLNLDYLKIYNPQKYTLNLKIKKCKIDFVGKINIDMFDEE